jgi:hypothetical protein
MIHGRQSAYVAGCRCETCREANREAQARYRSTAKGREQARRNARVQRRAQALALAHLRATDRRAYFAVYDQAKEACR